LHIIGDQNEDFFGFNLLPEPGCIIIYRFQRIIEFNYNQYVNSIVFEHEPTGLLEFAMYNTWTFNVGLQLQLAIDGGSLIKTETIVGLHIKLLNTTLYGTPE
jgi:hypothetical protein